MGVYTELIPSASNYRLKATFHGISHADGSLCPQSCSSHGSCSVGKCQCSPGWTGAYCLFKVDEVEIGQAVRVGERALAVQTEGLTVVHVEVVQASSEFEIGVLEGPGGKYMIPSEDYASYREKLSAESRGFELILSRISPLYVSIWGKTVTLRFSAVTGAFYLDSSSSSSNLILIVGITAPAALILTILSLLLLCYCHIRRQTHPNTEASPVLPLTHQKELTLLALNFISSDVEFQAISSHYSDICPVCLESYEKETRVRQLPCGHVYHGECLVNLACRQQICCVCKQTFERKLDQSMTTLGDFSRIERDMSP